MSLESPVGDPQYPETNLPPNFEKNLTEEEKRSLHRLLKKIPKRRKKKK